MRGPYFDHILTSMTLVLILAAPLGGFAQDSNEPAATFNERFPADQTSTRPPSRDPRRQKRTERYNDHAHRERETRAVASRCPGALVPRCWDRGATGERKFLDHAFPPTHVALEVVTNTGGRVGWHNSPLPGPLFPR